MNKFVLLLIPFALVGCADACEKAGDRVTAKYEECGVEVAESDEDAAESECDDATAEQADCVASCVEAADCTVIDGTADPTGTEYSDYSTCLVDCA